MYIRDMPPCWPSHLHQLPATSTLVAPWHLNLEVGMCHRGASHGLDPSQPPQDVVVEGGGQRNVLRSTGASNTGDLTNGPMAIQGHIHIFFLAQIC